MSGPKFQACARPYCGAVEKRCSQVGEEETNHERKVMATADATMTEERRTFLRRALDAAQIAGSKTLAVAKKAGGWIKRQATNLIKAKPVRWLWSKVQPAASKVWSWGAPYRKWTWKVTKKVAKSPFSWLVALLGGILVGSKIVLFFVAAALLLVVALIATIIYY